MSLTRSAANRSSFEATSPRWRTADSGPACHQGPASPQKSEACFSEGPRGPVSRRSHCSRVGREAMSRYFVRLSRLEPSWSPAFTSSRRRSLRTSPITFSLRFPTRWKRSDTTATWGVTLPEGPLAVAVHVAGHGLDPAHPFVAGQVEEPLERRAPFAARQPEHVPALQVEDHGRVPVPVVQLELVHPEQTRACGGRGELPPAVGRGPRVQARQPLPVDLPDDLAAQSGGQGDVRGRQPVGQQVLDQTDERQRGRAPGHALRCGRPGARAATRATRPGTVDRHDAPGTPERQMGEPARRRPVRARPPTAHGTGSGRGTQRLAGNLQHRERTSPGNPPGPEIERARGLHARARLPEPRHRRRQLQRWRRQRAPATHRRIGHRASRSHRPAWSQTIIRQAPSTPHSAQETAESQKQPKSA